ALRLAMLAQGKLTWRQGNLNMQIRRGISLRRCRMLWPLRFRPGSSRDMATEWRFNPEILTHPQNIYPVR
ncbi:MAG: hypothetical protein WBC22_16390, partial [Sedimentisphaerales bacterium]